MTKAHMRHQHSIILPHSSLIIALFAFSCSSPPPMPQWENTGGPYAQNLSSVLIDRHNASQVFVGTTIGELFVTTDRGDSWTKHTMIADGKPIHTIINHPENASTLFAGTGGGLFLSKNSGAQWSNLNLTGGVRSIAIDPFNPQMIYAGVDSRGVLISSDAGISWSESKMGMTAEKLAEAEVHALLIDAGRPNFVYAAVSGVGIAISDDAGKSWKVSADQLAASGTVPLHFVLHPQSGHMCFGTAAGDIFKSSDGGTRWSPTRQGNSRTRIGGLAQDASDPNMLYAATEDGLMVSTDFGTTWKNPVADQPRVSYEIAASLDAPRLLYAFGEGAGLKRSTNGGLTWTKSDVGLGGSTVAMLSSDRMGRRTYAVTGEAVYYLSTGTTPWISVSSGLHGGEIVSTAFDVDSTSVMYAGCTEGIFRLAQGSWTALPRNLGPHAIRFFDTHATINTRMFVQNEVGFFYSTNRGFSWNPTKPVGSSYNIQSLSYAYNNAGFVHAALREKAIIGSTDGGISWISRRYGIKSEDVLAVTHGNDGSKALYAWTSGGDGFRSMNQGLEWDRYSPPWKQGDRIHLWVDKYRSSNVVALVNVRTIYHSENGGGTWKHIQTGELREEILDILWQPGESALYAGTRDHGVFRIRVGNAFTVPVDQD